MRTLFLLAIALIIGVLPLAALASWNIDFQGANTTDLGQVGPIDYVFPNSEVGNYLRAYPRTTSGAWVKAKRWPRCLENWALASLVPRHPHTTGQVLG